MTVNALARTGVALTMVCSGVAMAQDGQSAAIQLPPGVAAQFNLGQAGLLSSYYSGEWYKLVLTRLGESRATVARAKSGGPTSGYRDETTSLILPVSGFYALPDGRSHLRFSATGIIGEDEPNILTSDYAVGSVEMQYVTFPNSDTMLAFGVFGENSSVDYGNATVDRPGYGVRIDGIRKLSGHWGVVGRLQYSFGELDTRVDIAPGLQNIHIQGDNRLYAQTELVGQFRNRDLSFMPQGWVLHPSVGALYLQANLEATADNFGNVSSGVLGTHQKYYLQTRIGYKVKPDMPGLVGPEVEVLYGRGAAWLSGKSIEAQRA